MTNPTSSQKELEREVLDILQWHRLVTRGKTISPADAKPFVSLIAKHSIQAKIDEHGFLANFKLDAPLRVKELKRELEQLEKEK